MIVAVGRVHLSLQVVEPAQPAPAEPRPPRNPEELEFLHKREQRLQEAECDRDAWTSSYRLRLP